MSIIYNSYGFLFAKVHQKLLDILQPTLSEIGINAKQMGLLFVIQENPGVTQKDAGAVQQIDRSTMTQSIDTLEKMELVKRVPQPTDRRAYGLYLTDKGKETTESLWDSVYEAQQTLFLKLKIEDIDNLKRIVTTIVKG